MAKEMIEIEIETDVDLTIESVAEPAPAFA